MRRHSVWLLTLVVLAACGDNSDTDPDATPSVDARGPADASSSDAPSADAGDVDAGPDGAPDADLPDAGPDATPAPPTNTEQCARTVPRATTGTCDATDGTGTAVVVRGNILGEETIFLDGEVVYDGNQIVCADCDCSAAAG